MEQNVIRPDLLPMTVPTFLLWVMALIGVAAWISAHRDVARKDPLRPSQRLGILVTVGTLASWTVMQLLGRWAFLAGSGHLLLLSFVSALSIELVSHLYRRECGLLPRRACRMLVACRMAVVIIILFMLLQPVLVGEHSRTIRRRVVVLMDDSASMNLQDKYWTVEERVEVSAALGVLEEVADEDLKKMQEGLPALAEEFAVFRMVAESSGEGADGELLDKKEVAKGVRKALDMLGPVAEKVANDAGVVPQEEFGDLRDTAGRASRLLGGTLVPTLEKLGEDCRDKDADIRNAVKGCADAMEQLVAALPDLQRARRAALYARRDEAGKAEALAAADATRAEIGRRLLSEDNHDDGETEIEKMRSVYDIDVYRFAANPVLDSALMPTDEDKKAAEKKRKETEKIEPPPIVAVTNVVHAAVTNVADAAAADGVMDVVEEVSKEEARIAAFRAATDITLALEMALREIPSEELAGFLVVTDGRYNGAAGVDAVARRLGNVKAPVSAVVLGGSKMPVDVAFGEARAPESVFLGDKVHVTGTLVATRSAGKEAKVRLYLGEEMVEEQVFRIENDDFEKEFRFTHKPESRGVIQYRLEIEEIPDEEFKENNKWTLDVAVSDDRTNVLLVDSRPRWEFRYLRNLFYGRDKSVHLQEYLIKPDRVAGVDAGPLPAASAGRPFGESESSTYPLSREEWRKFAVIILGDLNEYELPADEIENIKYCVAERGALLVMIAGPNSMPHKINNETLRELMPVVYEPSNKNLGKGPETRFRLKLTPAGRIHQVMMQSSSQSENEEIWEGIQTLDWRCSVEGVKPGAEVLAYAVADDGIDAQTAGLAVNDFAEDPDGAVKRLEEIRREQAKNSLVVAQQYGKGKVLMLNTDQSWRLRYKVGDVLHHQFWGQVLRWGAGEKLRAGNSFLRIGTDRLRYAPGDPVVVYARISDAEFNAMNNLEPTIKLYSDEAEVETVTLEYREGSNGFYEGKLSPLADPGKYRIVFESGQARDALGGEYPEGIETHFVVVTAERPAEFVNITASKAMPLRMAEASGGKVVGPADIEELQGSFGEGNRVVVERTEKTLWNSWILYAAVIGLLTAEWIVRKRHGVA